VSARLEHVDEREDVGDRYRNAIDTEHIPRLPDVCL
jgi:hypothetical protein